MIVLPLAVTVIELARSVSVVGSTISSNDDGVVLEIVGVLAAVTARLATGVVSVGPAVIVSVGPIVLSRNVRRTCAAPMRISPSWTLGGIENRLPVMPAQVTPMWIGLPETASGAVMS